MGYSIWFSILGFVSSPTMKVAADIILHGTPNKTDLPIKILNTLEQSAEQLLEGSLMAVGASTEIITQSLDMNRDSYPKVERNSTDLKEMFTEQCYNSLFECHTSILVTGKDIDLIKTPREDIFFAWIEKLKGTYELFHR